MNYPVIIKKVQRPDYNLDNPKEKFFSFIPIRYNNRHNDTLTKGKIKAKSQK